MWVFGCSLQPPGADVAKEVARPWEDGQGDPRAGERGPRALPAQSPRLASDRTWGRGLPVWPRCEIQTPTPSVHPGPTHGFPSPKNLRSFKISILEASG